MEIIKCVKCACVLGEWEYSFPTWSDCNLLNMSVKVKCPQCNVLLIISACSSGISKKNVVVTTATTSTRR
jgi:phage FluMu protein Com